MKRPLEKTQIVLYALVAVAVLYLGHDFLVIVFGMEPVAWFGDPEYCQQARDVAACECESAYAGVPVQLRPC